MPGWDLLTSRGGQLLTWGLATRGIGLSFLACFASIALQVIPLAGARGISPVGPQLRHMRQVLPWYRCLQLNPSVLWLAHGDLAIRLFVALGMVAAAAVVAGGPATPWCLLVCWVLALSFQFALRLHYPWDAAILETGFLSLFLPPLERLPSLAAISAPPPLVAFAFNFLLFRIMFGFGKEKFLGFRWNDTLNTRFFLLSIPSVSPIGWFAARVPGAAHRAMFAYVAFAELLCPWLLFLPGPLHLVAVAGITGQMLAIQLNSNFGFFNLCTLALCMAAIDPGSTLPRALADPLLLSPGRLPFTLLFAVIFSGSFVYFPFNSWVSAGFLDWPALRRIRSRPARWFLALLRFLAPARLLNAYGVFSAHPAPPVRWLPIVEGTRDGVEWREYPFRYQMTVETDRPQVVAPHHPRLEGVSFYEAFGVEASGYLTCLNFNNPLWFTPGSMLLDRALQRLLEPDSPVVQLWKRNPFPEGPPARLRVALHRVTATSLREWSETGRWWKRRRVGLHLPETGRDERAWTWWLPPRELFHQESPAWARAGATVPGPSAAELEAFWEGFLPFVRERALAIASASGRFDAAGKPWVWGNLPELALAIRRRFTRDEVRGFQLTLARLTAPLLARWGAVLDRPAQRFLRDVVGFGAPLPDPYSLPADAPAELRLQALTAWPRGPLRTHFHLGLAAHRLILTGGREAWERAADGPLAPGVPIPTDFPLSARGRRSMAAAAADLALDVSEWMEAGRGLELQNGFFLEGAVNYEVVARHANRFHVLFTIGHVFPAPGHGLFPGAETLTRELSAHPELRLISGWGDQARLEPEAVLPRMVYGDDGVWREPESPAGRERERSPSRAGSPSRG